MKAADNSGKLAPLKARILLTLSLLKKRGKAVSVSGLRGILRGEDSDLDFPCAELSTFSTMLSLSGRMAAGAVNSLVASGHVRKIYKGEAAYYTSAPRGEELLEAYLPAHPKGFKRKKRRGRSAFIDIP